MKLPVHRAWNARSPRERSIIVVLAIVLGATLYLWLIRSADRARARLRPAVMMLQTQQMELERDAAEISRLRAIPPAPASPTHLRTLVQEQVETAGLTGALTAIEAVTPDEVRVVIGSVQFSRWLDWISKLQSLQIRLSSCRIEALSSAGLVSVTGTLVRAPSK